jgi:hypothetical protein
MEANPAIARTMAISPLRIRPIPVSVFREPLKN